MRIPVLFWFAFFFLPLSGWAQDSIPTAEPGSSIWRHLDEGTGVEIIFETHDGMFPKHWIGDKIQGTAVSLEKSEIERSLSIIKSCLAKYPDSLIQKHLKSVYVMSSLEFYGTSYGGTYSSNKVFVSNKGAANGYSHAYIEKVFHAEFSSILFNNFEKLFSSQLWKAANAEGATYGGGGVLALKAGKSSENFQEELNKMGFLNEYATSSVENDFNSFAKNIFFPTKEFWSITSKFEGLNKKLMLIVGFYHAIDPSFDLEYFQQINTEKP